MPVINAEQAAQLQKIEAQNQAILASTEWQWAQMANDLSAGSSPTVALNQPYKFTLANTSAYLDRIRIWIQNCEITNSSTTIAGALNRAGFAAILGSLVVRLGNHLYRVPAGAIPLLYSTYTRVNRVASYRGSQSFGYSANLYAAPATIAASGNATYTIYVDIPTMLLEMVYDPDGATPTLSNVGIEVSFTTPTALQGTDALLYPFTTAGTLAVSATTPGIVSVWARLARLTSVAQTGSLPPFVVGPAFIVEDVPQQLQQGPTFYPFQGQQAQDTLVKSLVIVDNPTDLAGEFSDPSKVSRLDLMYDAQTAVWESSAAENPYFPTGYTGGPSNQLVDIGQRSGDQPPGLWLYDWGRGTDADYPNSVTYMDLDKFSRAGVRLQLTAAPNPGALIHFINVYLKSDFFVAQKG